MKRTLLLTGILYASSALAADSALLEEIMGSQTYKASGISALTQEQLEVLEKWVINNAIEQVVVRPATPRAETKTKTPAQTQPETSDPRLANQPASQTETLPEPPKNQDQPFESHQATSDTPQEPRYVKLAEEATAAEDSEAQPVTQKYVRIETLREEDRLVEPDLIRSKIDGPFKGWRNNKTRFRLENGEVWEQRQSSTYITQLDSPEVIIRKNRFGYTMEVPAIGRSVHVKRIR